VKLFGRKRGQPEGPSGRGEAPSLPLAEGARLAGDIGQLWKEIEAIAREDGLTGRSAVEHFNSSAEGKKDVERWLQIYLRRIQPGRPPGLPAHLPRHRGYCLLGRVWPEGLSWEAIDEETLFRAKLPPQPDRQSLIAALDRYLESPGGAAAGTTQRPS
jgi:hypothetical protein